MLITHKAEFKIDQEYLERTGAIFTEADQGLKTANEAMRTNLRREQESSPNTSKGECS
jgi:hypothetical protein